MVFIKRPKELKHFPDYLTIHSSLKKLQEINIFNPFQS